MGHSFFVAPPGKSVGSFVLAPTTKAVGSIDVPKLEPTASVVGLLENRGSSDF
jgi:hypothetical protein